MKHLRIAMWSGPRNISTAMMRSFSSRSDTYVSDEPFYANYLMRTGIDHPGREEIIESYDTDYDSVISDLQNDIPDNKSIWYQKHMAQHIDPTDNLNWTNNFLNCLLIRNPNEVIPSFLQKSSITDLDELGYSQQLKLLKYHDYKIPTVDAKDILLNPKSMLTKICSFFKIEFEKEMLFWNQGSHPQDGIWGKYWYDRLWESTTFSTYKENTSFVDDQYKDLLEKCTIIYNELYKYRIRP